MLRSGKRKSDDAGFTLIELLVTVLILGVLAAIAVPTFLSVRDRGYRATVQSDLRNAAVAMEVYNSLEGRYPTDAELSLPRTEPDVQLRIALPTDAADAQVFCLEGSHANLNDGAVIATYDQRIGGLTDDENC